MTRPNKLACALLAEVAVDADTLACLYRSLADNVTMMRDGALDGDAEKIMLALIRGKAIAMRTAPATMILMSVLAKATSADTETFNEANRAASRSVLRDALADMPLDDLVAERDHHALKCDGLGCVSHEVMEEEIARRAPH